MGEAAGTVGVGGVPEGVDVAGIDVKVGVPTMGVIIGDVPESGLSVATVLSQPARQRLAMRTKMIKLEDFLFAMRFKPFRINTPDPFKAPQQLYSG